MGYAIDYIRSHICLTMVLLVINPIYACSYVHSVRGSISSLLYNCIQCCISYSYGLNLCRIDLQGGYSKWLYLVVGHLINCASKRIVFIKIKAIPSVVYVVGIIKDFVRIFNNIIIHKCLKFSLNISKCYSHKVPYWCTNLEQVDITISKNQALQVLYLVAIIIIYCSV